MADYPYTIGFTPPRTEEPGLIGRIGNMFSPYADPGIGGALRAFANPEEVQMRTAHAVQLEPLQKAYARNEQNIKKALQMVDEGHPDLANQVLQGVEQDFTTSGIDFTPIRERFNNASMIALGKELSSQLHPSASGFTPGQPDLAPSVPKPAMGQSQPVNTQDIMATIAKFGGFAGDPSKWATALSNMGVDQAQINNLLEAARTQQAHQGLLGAQTNRVGQLLPGELQQQVAEKAYTEAGTGERSAAAKRNLAEGGLYGAKTAQENTITDMLKVNKEFPATAMSSAEKTLRESGHYNAPGSQKPTFMGMDQRPNKDGTVSQRKVFRDSAGNESFGPWLNKVDPDPMAVPTRKSIMETQAAQQGTQPSAATSAQGQAPQLQQPAQSTERPFPELNDDQVKQQIDQLRGSESMVDAQAVPQIDQIKKERDQAVANGGDYQALTSLAYRRILQLLQQYASPQPQMSQPQAQ